MNSSFIPPCPWENDTGGISQCIGLARSIETAQWNVLHCEITLLFPFWAENGIVKIGNHTTMLNSMEGLTKKVTCVEKYSIEVEESEQKKLFFRQLDMGCKYFREGCFLATFYRVLFSLYNECKQVYICIFWRYVVSLTN